MRRPPLSPGLMAGIALTSALALGGCSAGGDPTAGAADAPGEPDGASKESAGTDPAPQGGGEDADGGLTDAEITEAIEQEGLACEEVDPRLDGREQVIECRGDDYIFVTATRLSGTDELERQFDRGMSAACESGHMEVMRYATSDVWLLTPGGERDKDVAVFSGVTQTLGLELQEAPC